MRKFLKNITFILGFGIIIFLIMLIAAKFLIKQDLEHISLVENVKIKNIFVSKVEFGNKEFYKYYTTKYGAYQFILVESNKAKIIFKENISPHIKINKKSGINTIYLDKKHYDENIQ